MGMELLFLLLPVAAISGWWVGRSSLQQQKETMGPQISTDYFRGLNYLLNEQQDKAIEVFTKMLEVDSETIETHFTVGNLFRRRGEVDRAIKIHQNLIARSSLSQEQRFQGLYELGLDYMRAGILSRAEGLFLELVEKNPKNSRALTQLIDIYEQEKDWERAIKSLEQYMLVSTKTKHDVIAQFYCELADNAILEGDFKKSCDLLKTALDKDKNCVRASLMRGSIAIEMKEYSRAIEVYRTVEFQDPDYLLEVIEPLLECSKKLDKVDEIMDYFLRIHEKHGGITAMLAIAELIEQNQGIPQAITFITDQLHKRPSVRGLNRLIELSLTRSDGDARDNLVILRDLTNSLLEDKAVYKCNKCGFSGRFIHWHCPSCRSWNSFKPIHGVEGE